MIKEIRVKNIELKFDSYDMGCDRHNVLDKIEAINEFLQTIFPSSSPRLIWNDEEFEVWDVIENKEERV